MNMYLVTFRWGAYNDVFCANLVQAKSLEAAELYCERKYFDVVAVREVHPVEAESYKKRGMPVVVAK